ncbi:FIST C-terminal domain-containing protein [Phormidium tenue FACHB-886]|nr:FIST C-terminal domain-containing protein [Phormidium tenue FACHB-886]
MKWVSAISTRPSLEAAVQEAIAQAQQSLSDTADLGLVFISSAFASEYSRLMPLLQEKLSVPVLVGCGGGGVIGADAAGQIREVEGEAAFSLTLAKLPGAKIQSFHLASDNLPDMDGPPDAWIDLIGVSPAESPHFILFADPGSAGVNELLQGLDFAYPGSIKVGGLADINAISGSSGLFCNYRHYSRGIVGVALSGNVVLEAIVAQGCRPIGQAYRVVEGDRNILMKLEAQGEDGISCGLSQTPLEILQTLFQDLSEEERVQAQRSLFVGIAQSAFKQQLEQGDFLIRTLLGVDPRTGAVAIGDRVRPGQRVQFHLRDAAASAEDLETLLQRYQKTTAPAPIGALLFACLGRGEGLYQQPDFDSRLFSQYNTNVSLSGFFCNGEIGPVGDTTFLHGYTSVFGICRQLEPSSSRKGE